MDKEKPTNSEDSKTSPEGSTVSSPVVSGGTSRRWLPSRKVVFASLLVLVIVAVAVAIATKPKQQPALEVSAFGKKLTVSKSEYSKLTKEAGADGLHQASSISETVANAYSYKLITQYLNSEPSQEQLSKVATALYSGKQYGKLDDWQQLKVYIGATDNLMSTSQNGDYEGDILYYPYNQLFVYDPGSPKPPHFGEADAIAANKSYAQQQANKDHDALAKHTITVDKVMSRIKVDPQLQFADATNDSTPFAVGKNGTGLVAGNTISQSLPAYAAAVLQKMTGPGISPVEQIKYSFSPEVMAPGYPTTTDVAYYYLYVSKVAASDPSLQQKFHDDLKQVKVVKNDI